MCKDCGCGQTSMRALMKIEGMTCNHCKESVEGALLKLPGVMSAEVNLEAKTATVDYHADKVTVEQFKETVENIGFDVQDIKEVAHEHHHGILGAIGKFFGK